MGAQRRWQLWLVTGIIAIAGIVYGVMRYRARQAPAAAPAQVPAAQQPSALTLTGKVRARNVVPVGAPIDGTLENVEVIDGQDVAEGQLLARIKNTTLELAQEQAKQEVDRIQERLNSIEGQTISARLEASRAEADATRASAQFAVAEKNYARQKMLLAEGAVARLTFEKAEKEYQTLKGESEALSEIARQAQSKVEINSKNAEEARKLLAVRNEELDSAKSQLLATEVHAPVDGVLIGHRAEPGAEVTHDMRNLFEIAVNLSELRLVADATPAQLAALKAGQPALIVIAETGEDPFPAVVRDVTGSQAIFDFNSANPAAKPGLTAQVRVALEPATSR